MNKQNFTSIRVVHDRILRDPIFIGIGLEAIIDYLVDFLNIVGAPNLFKESILNKHEFSEYRMEQPIGFQDLIHLEVNERVAQSNLSPISAFTDVIKDENNKYNYSFVVSPTYRIAGNYIYFPVESGLVTMVYKSIPVDDDITSLDYGLPMVEDDPIFMLAFQSYVEVQWLRMLVRAGKVPGGILDEAKQSYSWNVGRYETHSKKLSVPEMESISKMFRTPFNRTNEFSSRFRNLNSL